MPVEFLSDEQAAAFGQFGFEVSTQVLERWCWLDDADLSLVGARRGDHNRLGFAVQLATVRLVGRFLVDPVSVPWSLVCFLAGQLGMADASVVKGYAQRLPTQHAHAREISLAYGYVDFADPQSIRDLRAFLSARAWTSSEGPTRLFDRATTWLREHKVLLPGVSVLARLVSAVRAEQAERLYAALAEAAGPATLKRLESLLRVDEGFRVSGWERLRSGPTRVSVPELLRQADRLVQLRGLGLSDLDVAALPAGPLNAMARFGMAGKPRRCVIWPLPGAQRRWLPRCGP